MREYGVLVIMTNTNKLMQIGKYCQYLDAGLVYTGSRISDKFAQSSSATFGTLKGRCLGVHCSIRTC